MTLFLADTTAAALLHGPTATALIALAAACGVLSLIVLWRRWAFLGEAIAHAGFGGAGTAWLVASLAPSLDSPAMVSACVVAFGLLTALAVGVVHRNEHVHSDTAIGVFLAGALAWGFVGQEAYFRTFHRAPAGFQSLLFGQTQLLQPLHAQLAVALLILTLGVLALWRRQILMYCLDPALAQSSGINAGIVHYAMILLVAVAITTGVPLVGSVLVTALLILPGAAASLISRRLGRTVVLAIVISVGGTLAGLLLNRYFPAVPQGPGIVLSLFVLFLLTWAVTRRRP
jgi:ABC-type Mn2+/Zn2+ transport system permease subunit